MAHYNAKIFFPFMLRHLFRVGVCNNERQGNAENLNKRVGTTKN